MRTVERPCDLAEYLPVPGSKIVGKAGRETLRRTHGGTGDRGKLGSGSSKHCFQCLTVVYQPLVYYTTGQFWQLTATLTSTTWLRARRVKQKWRACETHLHRTVWLMIIWHEKHFYFLEVGGVVSRLRYLKRCLLSSRRFSLARFFTTRPKGCWATSYY